MSKLDQRGLTRQRVKRLITIKKELKEGDAVVVTMKNGGYAFMSINGGGQNDDKYFNDIHKYISDYIDNKLIQERKKL